MAQEHLVVVTGDKGGVGKSTIVVLLTEWFKHQGDKVKVIDSDPTQNTQTWVNKCERAGYQVSEADGNITVVDTAGTSGASNTRNLRDADLIIVPFQPHVADLETVVGWFLTLREEMAQRVVFVPNRLENTKEQREGISQLESVLESEGRGVLLSGLANRPAVYPPLLNGSATNFFDRAPDEKVLAEIEKVMQGVQERLRA